MIRVLGTILSLALFTSCIGKTSVDIKEFEDNLGKHYSKILSECVAIFEEELALLYPSSNIRESYTLLVDELSTWSHDDYEYFGEFDTSFVNTLTKKIRDSDFEKELFLHPSFVDIKDRALIIKHQYINDDQDTIDIPDEEILPITRDYSNIDTDSLIAEEYKVIEYNFHGLYHQSLCNISTPDSLIVNYLDSKSWGFPGRVNSFLFYQYYNPDFDNYFAKRLLLVEFLY